MLIRLTFVNRFVHDGLMFLKARVYNVDEAEGIKFCQITDRDMPIFKIVGADQIGPDDEIIERRKSVLEAEAEDDKADEPVTDVTPTKESKPKKAAKAKPKLGRGKKGKGQETDSNIDMV